MICTLVSDYDSEALAHMAGFNFPVVIRVTVTPGAAICGLIRCYY